MPPVVQTVEVEKPLPREALFSCDVASDDGSTGAYIFALETALDSCRREIEARLE